MAKKTFNEKLHDSKDMPVVKQIADARAIACSGGDKMLIAPPISYDTLIRAIPGGMVTTSDRMRAYLAAKHGADFTCQLTAGIFINIVALASDERGVDETPWWRALKKDGELNEKFPGGVAAQRKRLEAEGHTITQRGKRSFVTGYEQKLHTFD